MKVLLTGGAGYIGSHTLVELLSAGDRICVLDNFCNSTPEALARVRELTGLDFEQVDGDVRDAALLDRVFAAFRPDAVVHFAGLKSVAESVSAPLSYYANNVQGSTALLEAMDRAGCRRLVFSSSATVYGAEVEPPFAEDAPLGPTNPYGHSKLMVEQIIRDWSRASADSAAVLLRYFNPVGAHASGRIGEDPTGVPANLLPYVAQVAVGRREALQVFGDDYQTRDGTGERDYIHVVDLAEAHLAALRLTERRTGCEAINVGVGQGATVLELVRAFEAASGREVPCRIAPRRAGDVARSVARVDKAREVMGWSASRGLAEICESAWKWQSANPNGYRG